MKALRCNRAGASPVLALSIMQSPALDPAFALIWRRLSRLKRFLGLRTDFRQQVCGTILAGVKLHAGPAKALVLAARGLGWIIDASLHVHSEHGLFHLLNVSISELRVRAERSWLTKCSAELRHRNFFQDATLIDADTTRRSYERLGPMEQGLLRVHLSGARFSGDATSKFDGNKTGSCERCGALDTPVHHHRP